MPSARAPQPPSSRSWLPSAGSRARVLLVVTALLVATAAAAAASVLLRPDADGVATWWPAAGLAIAALALAPPRVRLLLAVLVGVVTYGANALGGRPVELGLVLATANAVEALVGAALLSRRGAPPRLEDTADHLRLLLAAGVAATSMALVSEVGFAVAGEPLGTAAPTVLPSHLAASLVLLPLFLLPAPGWRVRAAAAAETLVQAALLVVAAVLAATLSTGVLPLFLLIPLLVWAALRTSPQVTATEVAVVAVVLTWADARGDGALGALSAALPGGAAAEGNHVQVFLVCVALLAVPCALATDQRRRLVARLDAERDLSTTTLDTTAAIILVTAPDGEVQRVNAALERLTGWRPDQVVGRRFWECGLVPPERRPIVEGLYADVLGGTVPATREADVLATSGERLRVVWSNNVVLDADGRVVHVVCTASDVTSERTSTQLVEHLFGSPKAAPMLSLDEELRITLCNAASEQLLGVRAEDVVGRPFVSVVCPEQVADMEAALSRASTASRETRAAALLDHDWSWMRPDGTVVRLGATVSAVVDAVGRQVGTLLVASDVSRQVAQEDALQRALETERRAVERLRRLDAAKNDFVSTVSHELRTPTTSIVGYTEMLRDEVAGHVTDQQRELLEVITRNGMRLINVANDLLTLAGLESQDRSTWQEEPVDLVDVVRQAEETVVPLVGDRRLELDFTVPATSVQVLGDAAHLDRVVVNLLSNAVKFTPDGGHVRCRLGASGGAAVLEVSDTGIGIPADEQADLFTKFFRSSTAQSRAIPGTGLGLSIIHRIVTDHGGEIDVRSAEGAGTTFTVRLPLVAAPALSAG
ncbi:PAS domain-containing sensor histidine kinase [Nocardioides marmoraquaticus]